MIARLIAIARTTPVRVAVALLGMLGVALILRSLGWPVVVAALTGGARYLPLVFVLDGLILACSMLALRSLYGASGRKVPAAQLVRAGLVGYAVNGLLPAGRAVAEITRASLLARWVGTGTAAAAAARMQAVVLIGHGVMSAVATVVAVRTVGWTWLPMAISISAVVTLVMGGAVLVVTSRTRIGAWLGRRISKARDFGGDLDAAFERQPLVPVRAIAWELTGRGIEVMQKLVLLACVGGAIGLSPAIFVEGIHLLGAAIGDLVPAQLGVQEGNFTIAAHALGLTAAGAVSVALIAHLSQLAWVLVGSLVPIVWRVDPLPPIARAPELLESASSASGSPS